MEKVSFSYKVKKLKKNILEDFSISLQSGENLCICGDSKSGKSTLLYLMSGLKKPDAGSVFFNSMALNRMEKKKLEELRQKEFGFIFQKHFLINYLSIRENIMIAAVKRENESKRRLELFCE
ncbi:MAG TPA: ATP-binding cassette domain-containing protein, partial [Petrotogaceae bacterium]|nr:ATP-binding cassette domain-containing protein [Petrotogaceae bacterium]